MIETCILLIVLLLMAVVFYAVFAEPFHLQTNEYSIGLPEIKGKLRIVQFSDVHLKSLPSLFQLRQAAAAINVCHPDVVIFSGDLLDSRHRLQQIDKAAEILAEIQAPVKLAVSGNHDWLKKDLTVYKNILEAGGFLLLDNQVKEMTVNGTKLVFTGIPSLEKNMVLDEIMENLPQRKGCRILLAHQPSAAMEQKRHFDLALTAHNHGGQINLFRLPGLKNLSIGKDHDLQWLHGFYSAPFIEKVYVNTGVGTTHIPARLFASPEIAVFDLHTR